MPFEFGSNKYSNNLTMTKQKMFVKHLYSPPLKTSEKKMNKGHNSVKN